MTDRTKRSVPFWGVPYRVFAVRIARPEWFVGLSMTCKNKESHPLKPLAPCNLSDCEDMVLGFAYAV